MRWSVFVTGTTKKSRTRVKTVELVIEKGLEPAAVQIHCRRTRTGANSVCQSAFKQMAKKAGGRWNREQRLWFIRYGKIKGMPLEKHIILDADERVKNGKSI